MGVTFIFLRYIPNLTQNIALDQEAYVRERGGDARKLVIGEARVRALAESWGMGRVLEPTAIQKLLGETARDSKTVASGESSRRASPPGITGECTRELVWLACRVVDVMCTAGMIESATIFLACFSWSRLGRERRIWFGVHQRDVVLDG